MVLGSGSECGSGSGDELEVPSDRRSENVV